MVGAAGHVSEAGDAHPPSDRASGWHFPTTCWSRIVAAGDPQAPGACAALEALCRDDWLPLYTFIRRRGHPPEEAEDLVQGLLADLLERGDLAGVDRSRGRFRSFLLAACSHYLATRRDRDRLCAEIARTVDDPAGVDNEILDLDRRPRPPRAAPDPVTFPARCF